MEKTEENYLEALDIGYSYNLAKKLEEFRSNPALGYRTAGSAAERQAGQFLAREMERIGFSDVSCDRIDVDAWEFERAELKVEEAGRAAGGADNSGRDLYALYTSRGGGCGVRRGGKRCFPRYPGPELHPRVGGYRPL